MYKHSRTTIHDKYKCVPVSKPIINNLIQVETVKKSIINTRKSKNEFKTDHSDKTEEEQVKSFASIASKLAPLRSNSILNQKPKEKHIREAKIDF